MYCKKFRFLFLFSIMVLLTFEIRNATALDPGDIITIAGGGGAGDGGQATAASLRWPWGVAVDGEGNVYIADTRNERIRKVNPSGVITTIAGNGAHGFSGDGGIATAASLNEPHGVAVDVNGNVYIADSSNGRIRKVTPSGIITTVAGSEIQGYAGDGGPATSAGLANPFGIAVDSTGNIFIADTYDNRIRKVDTSGIITTVAGNGIQDYAGDGGSALLASLNLPHGIAVDSGGNLYIADKDNHCIRKVDSSGIITMIAGNGTAGYSGDGGAATSASLYWPTGVAIDTYGNIFVADEWNNRIRRVDITGTITTIAGNGGFAYSGDGGLATTASIFIPTGVAVDASGDIYIADSENHRVRKVNEIGTITTCAGNGNQGYIGDGGVAMAANLDWPAGASLDGAGNIFVVDTQGNRVRQINPAGIITTVAGNGNHGYSGDGMTATSTQLNSPEGITVDASGTLFIADTNNNRIRKVDSSGIITTVAGNGIAGYSGDGGLAATASLSIPYDVATDSGGNIFIADTYNNRIRKVDSLGIITTVAGNGAQGYSGDGGPATEASLDLPLGVAVDGNGNVFIADSYNNRIRKVNPLGIITTLAGNESYGYSGDGSTAISANLDIPTAVTVDSIGNIYIADSSNRIRKVDTSGIISTIAGNGTCGYSGDGGPAIAASLNSPYGVTVDINGNIYIADLNNNRLRMVLTSPPDPTPEPFAFNDQGNVSLNTIVESNTITVSGINESIQVSISGGEYSINGSIYTSSVGLVGNGATIKLRLLSADATSTTKSATLNIGGVTDTFSVTTISKLSVNLSLALSGTGSGWVMSNPFGTIDCTYPPQAGLCSTIQPTNTQMMLYAIPGDDSTFSGWGSSCSACSDLFCLVTLDDDKSCTALFAFAPLARILTTPYSTLQDAYNAAATNNTIIMLRDGDPGSALGTLDANANKYVTIKGGHNASYNSIIGATTIQGTVNIVAGQVVFDNVWIK